MKKRAAALLVLCGMFHAARADEALTMVRVISGDEVGLSDGRVVRVAGVKSVPEARAFLEANLQGLR